MWGRPSRPIGRQVWPPDLGARRGAPLRLLLHYLFCEQIWEQESRMINIGCCGDSASGGGRWTKK
jgi:hypothetical protein